MTRPELEDVPGVPETALAPELVAELPDVAPPAPWEGTARTLIWLARPSRAAQEALPPRLRAGVRALAVVGGMVQYDETPVGSYSEVFGMVAFVRGGRPRTVVPVMAVDSGASLVGGRTNWALPKTLASFDGEPVAGRTVSATARGWSVSAKATALGLPIPMRGAMRLEQEWPDGQIRPCTMRVRGRGRPALVAVRVDAAGSLAGWLRSGRHPGVVFESVRFEIGRPDAAATS